MGLCLGVRNMSDYGIEIFNSLGELVFSSDRRTVQILKAGTVSLDWGWDVKYIEFTPVAERPQIFAQTTGRYNIYADNFRYWDPFGTGGYLYDVDWWRMAPVVRMFEKNQNGLYYRIPIGAVNMYLWNSAVGRTTPGSNSGEAFDNIPYVIFL